MFFLIWRKGCGRTSAFRGEGVRAGEAVNDANFPRKRFPSQSHAHASRGLRRPVSFAFSPLGISVACSRNDTAPKRLGSELCLSFSDPAGSAPLEWRQAPHGLWGRWSVGKDPAGRVGGGRGLESRGCSWPQAAEGSAPTALMAGTPTPGLLAPALPGHHLGRGVKSPPT